MEPGPSSATLGWRSWKQIRHPRDLGWRSWFHGTSSATSRRRSLSSGFRTDSTDRLSPTPPPRGGGIGPQDRLRHREMVESVLRTDSAIASSAASGGLTPPPYTGGIGSEDRLRHPGVVESARLPPPNRANPALTCSISRGSAHGTSGIGTPDAAIYYSIAHEMFA